MTITCYPFASPSIGAAISVQQYSILNMFGGAGNGVLQNDVLEFLVEDLVFYNTGELLVEIISGYNVRALPGYAMVGGHVFFNSASETVTISPADPTYDRHDLLVARVDYVAGIGKFYVITGTPAVTPVLPSPVRNNLYFDIPLAKIVTLGGGAGVSSVEDLRNFIGWNKKFVYAKEIEPYPPSACGALTRNADDTWTRGFIHTADNMGAYSFQVPTDFLGKIKMRAIFRVPGATAGAVKFRFQYKNAQPGVTMPASWSVATPPEKTVGGTAFVMYKTDWEDAFVLYPGDIVTMQIWRDVGGTDTYLNTAELWAMEIWFVTESIHS